MTKKFGTKDLRVLIPFGESMRPPFLATHTPFVGGGYGQWLIRYPVSHLGVWVQVYDGYGKYQEDGETLSPEEFYGLTGLHKESLEKQHIDGIGEFYGYPGNKPLLNIPFTAKELVEFDLVTGIASNQIGDGHLAVNLIAEIEKTNPNAAYLARRIIKSWSKDKIAEAQDFRNRNGVKKTAEKYLASPTTIRKYTKPLGEKEVLP